MKRWTLGPLQIITGRCRSDRLSWFSLGPAGSRGYPVGISAGGPRRYVAALWLPRVRLSTSPESTEVWS